MKQIKGNGNKTHFDGMQKIIMARVQTRTFNAHKLISANVALPICEIKMAKVYIVKKFIVYFS